MALFATRDKMPGKLTVKTGGSPDIAATLQRRRQTLSSMPDLANALAVGVQNSMDQLVTRNREVLPRRSWLFPPLSADFGF